MTLDINKPPFMTRGGTPMHFIGYDMDGDTVWQYPDTRITFRDKNGRVPGAWSKPRLDTDADIINAPSPKVKETLWANIYPRDSSQCRGYLYSTEELARAKVSESASESVLGTFSIEVEYTPSNYGGYSNHPLETSTPNLHKPEPK